MKKLRNNNEIKKWYNNKKGGNMESKIILRDFNVLNVKQEIINVQNTINEYLNNGYKIKSSNITKMNEMKYLIYVLLEKD